MKKRSGIAPLIAIGGILLALSVGSFFLTPDRAFSENENRYLQLTPRLTWDRIMSGDFMEDVEDYTSDQIASGTSGPPPGRCCSGPRARRTSAAPIWARTGGTLPR